MTRQPAGLPFTRRQLATLLVYGVVLWFAAALLLRFLGPMGLYDGWARVALYALIIPGTWPFIVLARRLARLSRDQIALGYALATTAAMLCDGLALAWFPGLYGNTAELVAGSGAAILWGAGVGIALAALMAVSGRDPA